MSIRDTPRPVDVDVAGGNVLILVTEFGDRGGVRDFADWVEARSFVTAPRVPRFPRATAAMQDHEPTDNAETLTDLGHLAAGVGHHVINAFSAIVSNAELLRLKSPHIPVADPTVLAETIIHSALGAATVARRLIDYTRSVTSIDPAQGLFTPAVHRPRPAGRGIRGASSGPRTGGDRVGNRPRPVPPIQGHERQLRAMLGHLTRNACEAMPTQHGADRALDGHRRPRLGRARAARLRRGDDPRDPGARCRALLQQQAGPSRGRSQHRQRHLGRHRGTLSLRSQPGEGTVVRLCIEPIRA